MRNQPLRLEGISVHRVGSRPYCHPEGGCEISIRVLASRNLSDGTPELVTLYVKEEPNPMLDCGFVSFPTQSPEQHAARTAFMVMWEKFIGMADKAVVEENEKNDRKQSRRAKPRKRRLDVSTTEKAQARQRQKRG